MAPNWRRATRIQSIWGNWVLRRSLSLLWALDSSAMPFFMKDLASRPRSDACEPVVAKHDPAAVDAVEERGYGHDSAVATPRLANSIRPSLAASRRVIASS